jgi:hypothetical protein
MLTIVISKMSDCGFGLTQIPHATPTCTEVWARKRQQGTFD